MPPGRKQVPKVTKSVGASVVLPSGNDSVSNRGFLPSQNVAISAPPYRSRLSRCARSARRHVFLIGLVAWFSPAEHGQSQSDATPNYCRRAVLSDTRTPFRRTNAASARPMAVPTTSAIQSPTLPSRPTGICVHSSTAP